MQAIQLSLFDEPKESIYNEYFLKHFNWVPKVGGKASIHTTMAIENLYNPIKRYCMFAKVIVKEIKGDEAFCETTDEWVKAVEKAQSKPETKDLFRVKLKDLGMCFNQ